MTLWIGNGAVLKTSSQWQFKEFWKLNNSIHELFIFKILSIAIDFVTIIYFAESVEKDQTWSFYTFSAVVVLDFVNENASNVF